MVQDYYGKQLQSTLDLKTSACCDVDAIPEWFKPLLARIHPDVLTRYYGCGLVSPPLLEGCRVLDLGCGSGRDVYALSLAYPGHADPLTWEGIITATHAKYQNPFSALGSAREARDLLLQAIAIDPAVMDGSALVTLGALYFRVPKLGSFGDDDKARLYLERALALDQDNIDANYFYGKFLIDQGDRVRAKRYLEKAVAAPPRAQSPLADRHRHDEAVHLLNGEESDD